MTAKKIMVVEDESVISLDIRNSLVKMGYTVSGVAATGESALMKISKNRPDLVLMDIHLKGDMSGIDVSEKIKADMQIPIVYLTANADGRTFQEAKETDPYGYLLKPFEERELGIAIEIALNKHSKDQTMRSSESWYASALQSFSEAVIATDFMGRVVYMNRLAESLTGWTLLDVLDKPLVSVLAFHRKIQQFDRVNIQESVESILEAALRGQATIALPHKSQILTKHKQAVCIEGSATGIRDSAGTVIGSLFHFKEIITESTDKNSTAQQGQSVTSLSAQTLSNRRLSEQRLSEQYLADRRRSEQRLSEQWLSDQRLSEQCLSDQPDHPTDNSACDITLAVASQKPKIKEDEITLIKSFVQAFINEEPIILSTNRLVANCGDGIATLSDRKEGVVVSVKRIKDTITAIVTQKSRYGEIVRHVLIENSYFPICRRTNGTCRYQYRAIPEQCQIYHTSATELGNAWYGKWDSKLSVGNGMPQRQTKLRRENIVVLRRGSWYHIQTIVMADDNIRIKTIGGDIFITPQDLLVWGVQNWL
ncbi:MAG: response regulator [Phormidesmis sp.]